MRERPILFSAPMVRAILDGRKTQTRRVVKPQPPAETPHYRGLVGSYSGAVRPKFFWGAFEDREAWLRHQETSNGDDREDLLWPGGDSDGLTCDVYAGTSGMTCPFGAAANPFRPQGDRLWVRETWAHHPDYPETTRRAIYRADPWSEHDAERWRPSIHMPRWACRLVLEVTDVRVERLRDISNADAAAEGASAHLLPDIAVSRRSPMADQLAVYSSAREIFSGLWETINGPGSWDSNPWVWVIGFKRVEVAHG